MAEQEAKRSQPMASEAIGGQRLPFRVTAAAQAPFVQRFPRPCAICILVHPYMHASFFFLGDARKFFYLLISIKFAFIKGSHIAEF